MRCEVSTEFYRGFPVRLYWVRPNGPGRLNYGYQIEGDIVIESLGFINTTTACRHAAKVIDDLIREAGVPKARLIQGEFDLSLIQGIPVPKRRRRSSRAEGRNPRALGTNPRARKALLELTK